MHSTDAYVGAAGRREPAARGALSGPNMKVWSVDTSSAIAGIGAAKLDVRTSVVFMVMPVCKLVASASKLSSTDGDGNG